MSVRGKLAALLCLGLALSAPPARAVEPVPLPQAHAHNDYEHEHPLLDALDYGFCSIEADIFAVDGQLLVGHDRKDCSPDRTLEGLYLKPLLARAEANGGRIYPNGPTVILLIDFKSSAAETYPLVRDLLAKYEAMLTVFTNDGRDERAVTVILSGDSPRAELAAEARRLCAIDGRLADLDTNPPVHLVPLVSMPWRDVVDWYGRDAMPAEARARLRGYVARVQAQGRLARLWAAPQAPAVWQEMLDAKLDLLNADHLDRLRDFLLPLQGAR